MEDIKQELIVNFGFTSKEAQIAQYICEGKSNKEISAFIGRSLGSVKFHTASIYKKMGIQRQFGVHQRRQFNKLILNYLYKTKGQLLQPPKPIAELVQDRKKPEPKFEHTQILPKGIN